MILLIILLILLFGGGGGYWGNAQYGPFWGGGISLGTIILILLIWYIVRGGLR